MGEKSPVLSVISPKHMAQSCVQLRSAQSLFAPLGLCMRGFLPQTQDACAIAVTSHGVSKSGKKAMVNYSSKLEDYGFSLPSAGVYTSF